MCEECANPKLTRLSRGVRTGYNRLYILCFLWTQLTVRAVAGGFADTFAESAKICQQSQRVHERPSPPARGRGLKLDE